MVHQLIVTSAKQGLEGGSGDQAVLRSAGMPPQVASRLKAAGGYSHPFPHGDRRNPVVYVHRIEEAAGKTWHVLGCIRDVGSDHTGRSNFLAHMLAADQADVRGKKAGPAAVMASSDLFRHSWSGPPDGAAPAKTLIAKDEPPQAGSCSAWTAAGLDPGLAGDLAGNAAAGKPVVLVTRPGDDVLALFRDALRLVQPEKRWSVTFNTCAIESFNGIWTAIRDDLPQARGLRDSRGAVVIDLTKTPRGSDDPYARFARGEAETLPWQAGAKATSAGAAAAEAVLDAGPAAGPGKPPTLPPGTGSGRRWGADRDSRPIFIPPPVTERRPWWVARAFGAAVVTIIFAVLTVYAFRDDIENLVWPKPPLDEPKSIATVEMPAGPTPEEMARDEAEEKKQAIEAARQKLAKAGGDRTTDEIRAAAEALQEEIARLRQGTDTEPGLRIRPDGGSDPQDATQRAIAAANRADELGQLSDDAPSLVADLEAATTELAAAVGMLDSAKQQVPALAAAERQAHKGKMEQDQANDLANRQRDAFAAFAKDGNISVALPTGNNADQFIGSARRRSEEIILGAFRAEDLVNASLTLAMPLESIDSEVFAPEIVVVEPGKRWEVRYAVGAFGGKPQPPRKIATLSVKDQKLSLEVGPSDLDQRPVDILRRCVIFAVATEPTEKQPRAREIRLVAPKKAGVFKVDATAGRQVFPIPVPEGIFSRDTPIGGTRTDLKLPVSGVEVTVEIGSTKETFRLPEQADAGKPGIITRAGVQSGVELQGGAKLELKLELSLPQATLVVTPGALNPNGTRVDLGQMADFGGDDPEKLLQDVKKTFDRRVDGCPGREFKRARLGTKSEIDGVKAWFEKPLATGRVMRRDLSGHELVKRSMNMFFQAEYTKQQDELKTQWERDFNKADDKKKQEMKKNGPPKPDFPHDFDNWFNRCAEAKEQNWPREFESRLDAWRDWFWDLFARDWNGAVKMRKELLGQATEFRLSITSIAKGVNGDEHRVPLVEFDGSMPAATAVRADGDEQAAREPDPSAGQPTSQSEKFGF